MKTVIIGAGGQLGRALVEQLPDAVALTRSDLDITDKAGIQNFDWGGVDVIINAAAYTQVDEAETAEGAQLAHAVNFRGVSYLALAARQYSATLVHVSTEYVFDGTTQDPAPEERQPTPISSYGASKALGEWPVTLLDRHYLIRTSWVVGDGNNFVRTMALRAVNGLKSAVVNDQIGRLTFAEDLAAGIIHLIETKAPFGIYNLTNSGVPGSWAVVAKRVYELCGRDPADVTETSTSKYFAGKPGAAPRPANSVLDLAKIEAAGFVPRDWRDGLAEYLNNQP